MNKLNPNTDFTKKPKAQLENSKNHNYQTIRIVIQHMIESKKCNPEQHS